MNLSAVDIRFRTDPSFRRACGLLHHATRMLIAIEAEIARRKKPTSKDMRPMTIAEFQAKHRRT